MTSYLFIFWIIIIFLFFSCNLLILCIFFIIISLLHNVIDFNHELVLFGLMFYICKADLISFDFHIFIFLINNIILGIIWDFLLLLFYNMK